MNVALLPVLILFGVCTASVLRVYLSRYKSTGWAFPLCFIYNSIFGVAYIDVLKQGSLFGHQLSDESFGYGYIFYWLTLVAMLFHVWAFCSVRYRDT